MSLFFDFFKSNGNFYEVNKNIVLLQREGVRAMGINAITFCVTTLCNFSCKYCVQKTLYRQVCGGGEMSKEVVFKARELMGKDGRIGFFGGEPTLRMGFIRWVIKNNKNKFAITSNGSGKLKDYQFLMENSCFITISYDGRLSGDREGGVEVFKKIKKLSLIDPENLKIRVTLSEKSVAFFSETVRELVEAGVKNISFEPEDGIDFNERRVVDKFRYGIKPVIDYWFNNNNLSFNLMSSCFFQGPCAVRRGEDCYVLPSGKIFLCHKELTQEMYVGNLLTDNLLKIKASIEAKREHCQTKESFCLWQEKNIRGWNRFRSLIFSLLLKRKGGE